MILKLALVSICVYSYHNKISILLKAGIAFMLIPGQMNINDMWCFTLRCICDCLYYKLLSIINAKDKHNLAVFSNGQDRSDMAGNNDFAD